MNRDAWVAKAAEALRGHVLSNSFNGHGGPKPATCLCGEVISADVFSSWIFEAAIHREHLIKALADALLPLSVTEPSLHLSEPSLDDCTAEVSEVGGEWGVRCSGSFVVTGFVLPEAAERYAAKVDGIVVSRTVTVGAWKVAEDADVGAGIVAGVEVAPESTGSANGPQIEETP